VQENMSEDEIKTLKQDRRLEKLVMYGIVSLVPLLMVAMSL